MRVAGSGWEWMGALFSNVPLVLTFWYRMLSNNRTPVTSIKMFFLLFVRKEIVVKAYLQRVL